MSSGFIHFATYYKISFFFKPECIHHILFIHSPIDGRLGCFYIFVVKSEFSRGTTNNISGSFCKDYDSILAQQENFIFLKHLNPTAGIQVLLSIWY